MAGYTFYPVYALTTTKFYAKFNYYTSAQTDSYSFIQKDVTVNGDGETGAMPVPPVTESGEDSIIRRFSLDGKIYELQGWSLTKPTKLGEGTATIAYNAETATLAVPGAGTPTSTANLTPTELHPVYKHVGTTIMAKFKYYDASATAQYFDVSGLAEGTANAGYVLFPKATQVVTSYTKDGVTYTLKGWNREDTTSTGFSAFETRETDVPVKEHPGTEYYTYYPVYECTTTARYYTYTSAGAQTSAIQTTTLRKTDANTPTAADVTVPTSGFNKTITLDGRTFTFCGWRTDTTTNAAATVAATVTSESHTVRDAEYKYYAVYQNDTLALDYNTTHDGITAVPTPDTQYKTQYISTATGNASINNVAEILFDINPANVIPVKKGYTFIGWDDVDSEAETAKYAKTGGTLQTRIDKSLFARFSVNNQNVTFVYYDGSDLEGDYKRETKQVSYDDLLRDDTATNERYVVTAPTVKLADKDANGKPIIDSSNIIHANDKYHYVFREWVRSDGKGLYTSSTSGINYTAKFKNVQDDITVQATYDAYSHHYKEMTSSEVYAIRGTKYNQDNDVTAAKDATCTKDGYQYLKCEDCGHVWKKILPAFNHMDANGNLVITYGGYKAPTCEGTGKYATAACALCGNTVKTEDNSRPRYYDIADGTFVEVESADGIIPAIGHNYAFSETVAPTCTVKGYDLYVCANNEMHTEKRNFTDALGHQEKKTDEVPATCTAEGKSEKIVCERCNMVLVDSYVIPALGHAMTRHMKVEPTCTETGNIEYFTCGNCGKFFSDKDGKNEITEAATVKAALGHNFVETPAEPATCTKDGHTAGKVCSRCGEIAEGSTAVTTQPALGHDLDDGVRTESDKPCETAGYTTYSCQRDGCDYTEVVYDALADHTEKTIPEQPATCTEMGKSEYKVCDVCGKILTNYKWLPKIAHTYTIEKTPAPPATSTEDGVSAVMQCKFCDATVGGDVITALGHNYSEWIVTAATCENAGSQTKYCKRCGNEITETIPALGHTPKDVAEVPATCTEEGKTAGKICETCGTVLEGCEVIDKIAHTFGAEQVERPATCALVGLNYVECSACGYKEYTTVEKLPHTSSVTKEGKEATCTETGLTDELTCSECGEVLQAQTATPKLEHVWETIPAVAATCTEKGKTAYEKCVNCDTLLTEPKDVPATGHQWGEWQLVKAATCLEDGSRVRYCTVEGCEAHSAVVDEAAQTKVLTKLGHDMTKVEAKEAACEVAGNPEYFVCSRCEGKYYKNVAGTEEYTADEIVIPALEHDWTNPIFTIPTCTEKGYTTATCSRCGATYDYDFLEAYGHTGGTATCTEKAKCVVCGLYYGGYADHNYVTETVEAANCQERDVTTKYCTVCGRVASTTQGDYGAHHYVYDENHITVVKEGTCTEAAEYEVACEVCGESMHVVGTATGHVDADDDGVCDECGTDLNSSTDGTTTGNCDKCGRNHAGKNGGLFGYNGFICRIIAFFRMIAKLFGKK